MPSFCSHVCHPKPAGVLMTLAILVAILPVSSMLAAADKVQVVEAPHGVVVSVSQPASDVGRDVLKRGGNAVDAAIATAFALAVTYPPAGNIGGGGFMMVHPSDDRPPVCIEYRETAPEAATQRMFRLGESRHTHKIVGVPGTVRGMELAHRKFGSVPWKELVLPSVALARDGFEVNGELAAELNRAFSGKPTDVEAEFRRDEEAEAATERAELSAVAAKSAFAFSHISAFVM